jgi:hypothetical protein
MGNNVYTGQLQGLFKAYQELFNLIQNNAKYPVKYIKHLGIQAPEGTLISLNANTIEIGATGIYEINNVNIYSIFFYSDTKENVIIDYTIV